MTAQLTRTEAIARRMHSHALWNPIAESPGGIVAHFTAMQAQEYGYALWATAQRMTNRPDAASLAAAVDAGDILRTHVLRPTWHFVAPAEARWLLELTAPRVQRINAPYLRRNGLDSATLNRALALIETELAGGRHRSRAQLQEHLARSGLAFGGMAMGLVMMEAELTRRVISGTTLGTARSYALFDERVPTADTAFDRERALSTLVARFIATRGPVTLKDFAVWSGLTLRDAKDGLAVANDREPDRFTAVGVEDFACWWAEPGTVATAPAVPRVDLVQGYDEYVMSYFPSKTLMQPPEYKPTAEFGRLLHTVLIDGVMAGQWKHVLRARDVTVQIATLRVFTAAEREATEQAAHRYGRFLGVPAAVEWLGATPK
ncbi:winged helix DNA-binding protein [Microterricola gilva]|uniref:Winged helix DNA-binding protein n=1 Tax=Microterricola gilva TaxID=393267 RepID=A0A4Q8AQA2_9MICO|nr:winged helix DNA-binding domain-containing protein [Microterricola gilva]RZU66890.1 winged helix DNA-binding protein [Microterricola gilva]